MMAEKLNHWLLNAFLYYKRAILDFSLIVFMTWGAYYIGLPISQKDWDRFDKFDRSRYYIGNWLVVAGAIKAFFSTSVTEAKQAQKEGDTQLFTRKI